MITGNADTIYHMINTDSVLTALTVVYRYQLAEIISEIVGQYCFMKAHVDNYQPHIMHLTSLKNILCYIFPKYFLVFLNAHQFYSFNKTVCCAAVRVNTC